MGDIHIRKDGHAGRITLQRPEALNALTYAMCLALEAALRQWREDPTVKLVLIEGAGDTAFCAGGDLSEIYTTGMAGDHGFSQRFWRDEYRMNALIADYPKPVVSFLHGFTLGGGVGVGCHGSHRVVGATSRIALPECRIGLVPDVGGSYLLARAPGYLGTYLGLTGTRIGAGDALYAGFADLYLPEAAWKPLKEALCAQGDVTLLSHTADPAPDAPLAAQQVQIDRLFSGQSLGDILRALGTEDSDFAQTAKTHMTRNAPLAMAATLSILEVIRRDHLSLRGALELEYRFTSRATEQGDILQGIRAAIIDKGTTPRWAHDLSNVPAADLAAMLRPVTAEPLSFDDRSKA